MPLAEYFAQSEDGPAGAATSRIEI